MSNAYKNIMCCVCDSYENYLAWHYLNDKIYHCKTCDLEFVYPMRAASTEYYQDHETYKNLFDQIKTGNIHPGNHAIVSKIRHVAERYLTPVQRSVVDIGCGSGYFLVDLDKEGFECLGIDFNPEMIKIASDYFKLPARVACVEDLVKENKRFDLVIISHVLEHIEDPVKFMENIKRIMNPKGVLFIVLPNRNFIRMKRRFRKGELSDIHYPPNHLTFWSVKALENTFEKLGFIVEECHAQTYPESYQTKHSLINTYGIKNNQVASLVAETSSLIGRILHLQGANLFAVGKLK